ncbi:hypothetical protein SELSPUOL_00311 [Selenomonas sputigena ATCC 35185]|uniref:Uncharacterized protein n=1 Tax=Selenomonas sputigena (strain ATCC 35185 / DSM 20758 / CCUG 44933 / VPI D19B-28) TaxID=546271 RepID=C9LS87_SELS3|nr:hypothetical protein SELSPUOL_00311 [Selenomonas sputigena ATCC 35185]
MKNMASSVYHRRTSNVKNLDGTIYIMEFTMKVQEVKPEGRRRIGKLSLRAAHNVHKVDVCACSLCNP